MSLFDFIREILLPEGNRRRPLDGFEDIWQGGNEVKNPISQIVNEDFIEDHEAIEYRNGTPVFTFYSDPFEISRYFENQINNAVKGFFFGFDDDDASTPLHYDTITTMFRDEDSENFNEETTLEPPNGANLRDSVLKPGYEDNNGNPEKYNVDTDLDDKISTNDLSKIWSIQQPIINEVELYVRRDNSRDPYARSQSVTTSIIRNQDGTIEQRRTVRDSEGNVESTFTVQCGDNIHTTVMKTDKDLNTVTFSDVPPEIENFSEIRESQPSITEPSQDQPHMSDQNPLRYFPWHKFFGPAPKL